VTVVRARAELASSVFTMASASSASKSSSTPLPFNTLFEMEARACRASVREQRWVSRCQRNTIYPPSLSERARGRRSGKSAKPLPNTPDALLRELAAAYADARETIPFAPWSVPTSDRIASFTCPFRVAEASRDQAIEEDLEDGDRGRADELTVDVQRRSRGKQKQDGAGARSTRMSGVAMTLSLRMSLALFFFLSHAHDAMASTIRGCTRFSRRAFRCSAITGAPCRFYFIASRATPRQSSIVRSRSESFTLAKRAVATLMASTPRPTRIRAPCGSPAISPHTLTLRARP